MNNLFLILDFIDWKWLQVWIFLLSLLKDKNNLNLVPITQCSQCPSCKVYIPIPTHILANLQTINNYQSVSTTPLMNNNNTSFSYAQANPPVAFTNSVSILKQKKKEV